MDRDAFDEYARLIKKARRPGGGFESVQDHISNRLLEVVNRVREKAGMPEASLEDIGEFTSRLYDAIDKGSESIGMLAEEFVEKLLPGIVEPAEFRSIIEALEDSPEELEGTEGEVGHHKMPGEEEDWVERFVSRVESAADYIERSLDDPSPDLPGGSGSGPAFIPTPSVGPSKPVEQHEDPEIAIEEWERGGFSEPTELGEGRAPGWLRNPGRKYKPDYGEERRIKEQLGSPLPMFDPRYLGQMNPAFDPRLVNEPRRQPPYAQSASEWLDRPWEEGELQKLESFNEYAKLVARARFEDEHGISDDKHDSRGLRRSYLLGMVSPELPLIDRLSIAHNVFRDSPDLAGKIQGVILAAENDPDLADALEAVLTEGGTQEHLDALVERAKDNPLHIPLDVPTPLAPGVDEPLPGLKNKALNRVLQLMKLAIRGEDSGMGEFLFGTQPSPQQPSEGESSLTPTQLLPDVPEGMAFQEMPVPSIPPESSAVSSKPTSAIERMITLMAGFSGDQQRDIKAWAEKVGLQNINRIMSEAYAEAADLQNEMMQVMGVPEDVKMDLIRLPAHIASLEKDIKASMRGLAFPLGRHETSTRSVDDFKNRLDQILASWVEINLHLSQFQPWPQEEEAPVTMRNPGVSPEMLRTMSMLALEGGFIVGG